MKDFRVVSAKVLLKIQSVTPIRGFLPPSVVVVGEKLNLTKEVLFNGVVAAEFAISSDTRLIVRIPQSQVGKEFRELKVFSSIAVAQQDAALVMEIVRPVQTVSGIDRLVQSWMLVFMTNPGSDIFDPSSGGGGRAIVGRTTTRFGKGVSADLAQAIERTKNEIIRLQSDKINLPLSERLLSCNLEALQFDATTSALNARVSLQNMLGDQAEVAIG